MEQHREILELAVSGGLPEQVDQKSGLPLDIVRELIDAGLLVAIDASSFDGAAYLDPRITLRGREYLDRLREKAPQTHHDLLAKVDRLRGLMVAVSTGGPRIEEVNEEYRTLYNAIEESLANLGITNPIPYPDLWEWYGRWRTGDLPSYQSRRQFIADLINPLLTQIRDHAAGKQPRKLEPTGWPKVDRALGESRRRLAEATSEEQFQAIGLLCREVLISLAQAVYDPAVHPSLDGVSPSSTDAKRMFDNYLAATVPGRSNEVARRHARASYDLAVELQHRRTATFREAALCLEATASVVNVVAILSGRRDP